MKKRYGSLVYQLAEVCNEALRINQSKKESKIDNVSPYIHSYSTFKKYKNIWNSYLKFVPVKNIFKLDSHLTSKYLRHLKSIGQSKRQIMTVASALKKLEVTWNRLHPEITIDISNINVKEITKGLSHPRNDKSFKDPYKVIDNLQLKRHQIAAKIMLEGAARIREANHISPLQLLGEGQIMVRGKGGYRRIIIVKPDTYFYIQACQKIDKLNEFRFSQTNFRRDLKKAAEKREEKYSTPHSFRYNAAQRKYLERSLKAVEFGQDPKKAGIEIKRQVSEELGHHRPDITNRYLQKE